MEQPIGIGNLAFRNTDFTPSLDIYEKVEQNTSLISSRLLPINPVTALDSAGPFIFKLPEIEGVYS